MKTFTLFICSLLMATMVQGQIIHVPADYTTIQLGIDAANSGDTVLVAEGTYFEQINFLGKKPLMVASEFLMDGDTTHIANTIIDGSQPNTLDSASVVYFISGEDTTSILCGFTVQHGRGTYTPDNLDDRQGGGICIADAGAKIVYNRITHNTCDDTQGGNGNSTHGGGIGAKWAEADYWIVIENNTIDSNACISKYVYALGGGIATSYNTRLMNNVIDNNACTGLENAFAEGGGIACIKDTSWTNPLLLIAEHNRITHNLTQAVNNYAHGAGVGCWVVQLKFSENKVENNTVITGNNQGGPAGLSMIWPGEGSVISNNVFKGNNSNLWAGGLCLQNDYLLDNLVLVENNYFLDNSALKGGAFISFNVPVILQNNVFSGNHADLYGGALYFVDILFQTDGHLVRLSNNTFSGNTAGSVGGAIFSNLGNPLIVNSIFWQNSAITGAEIYSAQGSVEIAYSDINTTLIFGNKIIGPGVIAEDPVFSDLTLLNTEPWSLCVDAGINEYTCSHNETFLAPAYDITGVPRPAGNGYDMGAYDQAYSGVGFRSIGKSEIIFSASPNPFSTSTTFTYTLEKSSQVTLRIFDGYGRLVAEPINSIQQMGDQSLLWKTDYLPSGMYYCRLKTGNQLISKKIIKMN